MLDKRLVETLSRVFHVDPSTITPETSPTTLASWDSVGHINLVLELEEVFDVRFSSETIPTLNSARRLQEAIDALGG
jgi:acyl carrier protein